MMVKIMQHQRSQKNSQRQINPSNYTHPNHHVQNSRSNAAPNIESFFSSALPGNTNSNLNINLLRSMMHAASLQPSQPPPTVSASLSTGRSPSAGFNHMNFPIISRPHLDTRGLTLLHQARGIQRMADFNSRRQ